MTNTERSDEDILASVQSAMAESTPPPPKPKPKRKSIEWKLPGFHPKAKVATMLGELPLEALRRRDRVRTFSGKFVEVSFVNKIQLDDDFMDRHHEAHPVLIRKGALGTGHPRENLLLSPAQSIRNTGSLGQVASRTALELVGYRNIIRLPHSGFTYVTFHCEKPEIVGVDGLWFEVAPQKTK